MKKPKQQKTQQINQDLAKVRAILRHVRNVHEACLLLGERLIERGESQLGRRLITRGFQHDLSKFFGIEWDLMAPCDQTSRPNKKLRMAVSHHNTTNDHHPEFWGSIHEVPRWAVAEMICDWKSRSEEFGTSLHAYIKENATERWHFSERDPIYRTIMEFVNMLCDKPFARL